MQILIIDSLGVVKIQSDETKTKLVVDVLLVIVKLLNFITMFLENDFKQTLYVLEYRRSKSLVNYFIAKSMNTGKIFHIIEIAGKSTTVTPEYWWHNAKDLTSIKVESFSV